MPRPGIAPGQGSAAGLWVIVTRETTTGEGDYAGLPPTDHVTDAQVDVVWDPPWSAERISQEGKQKLGMV